jgi:hypothetical protein
MPQWGDPPPAPFPRGIRVDFGIRPEVRVHFHDQMAQLKSRIMGQPLDRIGPLGEVLRREVDDGPIRRRNR